MNNSQKFNFQLGERFLENYADPPEDPLGELTHFEMAIRRFCFEYDHKVSIEIGDERIQVFLDPDICMILDDNLPEQIRKLSQGKPIEIDFAESCTLTIKLVPTDDRISCTLSKFGTSGWEKHFEFDRTHVLDVLRGFLQEVMQLAVDKGYITLEEKEAFIRPAFASSTDEYKAISGRFGEVRYFITTLDQSDAVENLEFADNIQGSWSFSERVQRKLDANRANIEIFSYLAQGGIRFFNSIVVVLLPNSNDQREFWDFSEVKSQGKPVEKWVNLKVYKNVSRIVIDGQHRLLSLKRYWKAHTGKEPLSPQQIKENFSCSETFDIPVVYLVFGNLGKVGCSDESETVRDEIIKATRNIFTVINKTAKPIDKQTQLLLDDSKISALIPRKLLEERVIEERFIRWSSTSTSLTQSEPYLTTLDLVSQCTIELLKDYQKEALKKSFNSPIERNKALEDYYESHPKLPKIGTKALLKWFFTELQPFKNWVSEINHVGINLPIQPEQPQLNANQKARIKKIRDTSILYTIFGQKILFSAVSRFLLRIRAECRIPDTLNAISDSITKMDNEKFFNRNQSHWSHVLVQPNAKLNMITKGPGSERCIELIKMILLNSSDGVKELIRRTKEDVSNEVNWDNFSSWKKDFHVILPQVEFSDDRIEISSELDDYFAEVRDWLDSSEDDEEKSDEIEDDEEIFNETEEVKD